MCRDTQEIKKSYKTGHCFKVRNIFKNIYFKVACFSPRSPCIGQQCELRNYRRTPVGNYIQATTSGVSTASETDQFGLEFSAE